MPFMSDEEQQRLALAETALQHYALGAATPFFVDHNAGMVFRVAAADRPYLLKIHQRVGSGDNPSAAQLEPGLHWLADFARASDVTVQVPMATTAGAFVAQISVPDAATLICCTVQHWLDGALPDGDFSEQQARQIGVVMAKLHAFSRSYPSMDGLPALRHDEDALRKCVNLLRTGPAAGLLSADDAALLVAAHEQIVAHMAELGSGADVWGPVHGDLHYENLLFSGEEVRPIDFTGLRLAHYMHDIGITLYHCFHQGSAIRRALLDGYQQIVALPAAYQRYVEAFIAYAAIDNLAWNSTIPEQVAPPLFQRNMRNLITQFCTPLAEGQGFLFSYSNEQKV